MSIKSASFLIVAICIATSVNAQLPQFPLPFPFPFQPSPGMPGMPDITKCLSTLINIPGCFAEISQSIITGKFGNIGPACCKAFLEAEANCTPNLPFNPFFPPMLKQQCSQISGPPTTL
ncbi:uncharacterized protein LOC112086541 [Eutrema salsugineum]|uniref:uncharacterized protein LOC112086541 n=1 Tax=Eutrema salsugineum TaxID=72664 RepID=UPI000CED6DA5|nr:uncharacterized protein LOC112086541 [Eutrema salsugineum]